MKIAVYSAKPYDEAFLNEANKDFGHELTFFEAHLGPDTAVLARGFDGVCVFVNDQANAQTLEKLSEYGIRLIALRCAGFNNVDLRAAKAINIAVVRVPAYSPYAVAEHTIGLLLTLNRKYHRAFSRVREGNFSLQGLLGFDLHGLTAGVIGTGKIGELVAKILAGFGCKILAFDPMPNPSCEQAGVAYVELPELFAKSDIITLHCPLTPATHHLIDSSAVGKMKRGVTILNTSRGALIDANAMIDGLKSGQIGNLGLDVYEEEADLFFEDLSGVVIQDDIFARLLTFPNVIITGHQAFFTSNALHNIAETTLQNIKIFENDGTTPNAVPTP